MSQIHVTVTRHSAFYTPLIIAIAADFLTQEGLDPVYSAVERPKSVYDLLEEGAAHLGQAAISHAWMAREAGRKTDIVHFAQINERDGFFIAGRAPEPNFSWSHLVGKKVLVDHGIQPLAMFRYALRKAGVDYAKINIIDAGAAEQIEAKFRAGVGDYLHLQGPAPQQLEKDNAGFIVASVGQAIGPVAFSSLCAPARWLGTDMAKAFMRAYRKSIHFVSDARPREICTLLVPFFRDIDEDVLTSAIDHYQRLGCWVKDARISRSTYQVALDVFRSDGRVAKNYKYDDDVVAPPDER